ncbi:MAG: LamG-like jellyroll fold domain-containing protein [Sedimentisphaerales bacterium]
MLNSKIFVVGVCLAFGIAMFFAGGAKAAPCLGEYVPDDDTIGLWHLNENTGTTVVNATGDDYYDGILEGDPLPTWVTGRFDKGLHFSRFGDNGINLGPLTSETVNFTMEMNFKWDYAYISELGYLFVVEDAVFARANLVDHGLSPATYSLQYSVRRHDGVWVTIETPTDTPLDDKWHHLAFTREWKDPNVNFKVYVDGVQKASGSYGVGFWDPHGNAYLGSAGALNSIGGVIDEVRFSKVVRTSFQNDWGHQKGDINQDCYVDFKDIAQMALDWLKCTNPNDPQCTGL